MSNRTVYPLKYAEMAITSNDGAILEAGCGAGRILRYFHERGYDIHGFDFIEEVIVALQQLDPTLKLAVGDITKLSYRDAYFKYVLAFGLYHNLESGLDKAINETYRILQQGGKVCASFRADNIQTRLTDWLKAKEESKSKRNVHNTIFHKMNLTRSEFKELFVRAGFEVEEIYPVQNMPLLYRFSLLRAKGHKIFDEHKGRREGYQLSWLGALLQGLILKYFPDQFCNIYVLIARKPGP